MSGWNPYLSPEENHYRQLEDEKKAAAGSLAFVAAYALTKGALAAKSEHPTAGQRVVEEVREGVAGVGRAILFVMGAIIVWQTWKVSLPIVIVAILAWAFWRFRQGYRQELARLASAAAAAPAQPPARQ